jgi:hypothetical protein
MSDILEFMFLRKSDLKEFHLSVSDEDWDTILLNLTIVNSKSYNMIYDVMKSTDSFSDFIKLMVETKGEFPDTNGITLQQKVYELNN